MSSTRLQAPGAKIIASELAGFIANYDKLDSATLQDYCK